MLYPSPHKVHKVTILPRGGSLGHTAFIPSSDYPNFTKNELIGKIYSSLGGWAAEEVVYGKEGITTGCGSDLKQAS